MPYSASAVRWVDYNYCCWIHVGKGTNMPEGLKRFLKTLFVIIVGILLAFAGYVAYLLVTYNRIADNQPIEIENNLTSPALRVGTQYKATTYNIGFGAYTPDYTFFMDEGVMADGTPTVGEHSIAASRDSVIACTQGAIGVIAGIRPDFALFQEVDTDSTRSYQVNQKEAIEKAFPASSSAFAVNYHSAFLAYPIPEMHGIVNAGLLTMADEQASSAIRRSYPVDNTFPTKFFDLDRCFMVERFPVEDGHELVLINSHMSAYDEGGLIRAQQLNMLTGVMAEERAKGNYVVVGGDWNHALCGSETLYKSAQLIPPWVAVFDDSVLPEGFSVVRPENLAEVPTCRNNDIPYEKDYTYTVTIDGFIVSDNVTATAENIDTGFLYSDHNPVKLTFELGA